MVLSTLCILLIFVVPSLIAQRQSPCPKFFKYDPPGKENNRLYGTVTILSEIELHGVCIDLAFDKPSIQLINWFGPVNTTNNKEYVVENSTHIVVPNVPFKFRFYLKLVPKQKPPQLVGMHLNGRPICPEKPSAPEFSSIIKKTGLDDSFTDEENEEGFRLANGGSEKIKWSDNVIIRPAWNVDKQNEANNNIKAIGDFFTGDFNSQNNIDSKTNALSIPLVDDICGSILTTSLSFISFGQKSGQGEFPWHAVLYNLKNSGIWDTCGASLISSSHLLTTAACVTKTRSQTPVAYSNLLIELGKYYLNNTWFSSSMQQKNVKNILVHPQYNARTLNNNIAIIKLSSPATITNYVRPVCIWKEDLTLEDLVKEKILGTVAGWGINESGQRTKELSKTKMPIVSPKTCIQSLSQRSSGFASNETYCARFMDDTPFCTGDPGDGMVFPQFESNPNNPRWQLRGLVSISILQERQKCDKNRYVVFTDIAKYLDWIKMSLM